MALTYLQGCQGKHVMIYHLYEPHLIHVLNMFTGYL